jgi:GH43 family beta-xylosidase
MRVGLERIVCLLLVIMGLSVGACRPRTLDDHLSPGAWRVISSSHGLFRNPIIGTGADPWVTHKDGFYYYCRTDGQSSIFITRAQHLLDIGHHPTVKVHQAPPDTEHSRQLWAAELHFLDGLWYIYYAASDGDNETHRMYVLESESTDPMGTYVFKGKIAPATDRWAIDGTVLEAEDGRRYFVWSGWDADEDIQQNLYMAPMLNPWTIQRPEQAFLRLEAEEASQNQTKIRSTARASAGQAVGGIDHAESFVDFIFDMPQSGSYQIDIRYANGMEGPATHELSVNGFVQTVPYPAFGWNNFQTIQVFAPLVAGSNRLRFTRGTGFAELDHIEVKPVGSDRVVLSMPEYDYEKQGGPAYVNEGPQILKKNGKVHIIYSGSGSWTDDYNLIQLSFRGGDILNRQNWEKRGTVFARTEDVFGPGHASFTQSPDGKEDWIIYHAAKYRGAGWNRDVRAQPFTWDAEHNPVFGRPQSLVQELPVPSGSLPAH